MAYSRTINVTLDTKGIRNLLGQIDPRAEKVLDIAARSIEKTAKSTVAVDTGNLRASIHVEKPGQLQRIVADGTEYGVFVEYGTTKARRQPWLTPAVEAERPRLQKAWKELFGS